MRGHSPYWAGAPPGGAGHQGAQVPAPGQWTHPAQGNAQQAHWGHPQQAQWGYPQQTHHPHHAQPAVAPAPHHDAHWQQPGHAPVARHAPAALLPAAMRPGDDPMTVFTETRVLAGHGSAAQHRALLDAVADHGVRTEAEGRARSKRGCILMAGSFVLLAVGIAAVLLHPLLALIGVVGFLALLLLGIVSLVRGATMKREAVEPRRPQLCRRLIELLERDLEPGAPLHVHVDLRPVTHHAKLRWSGQWGMWHTSFFHDDWLWIQGRLADGTDVLVTATERARERRRQQRSASGRIKTKRKQKSKHLLSVKLRPRRKHHPMLETVAQRGHGAVQLAPFLRPKSLNASKGRVVLTAEIPADWTETVPGERTHQPRASLGVASMLLSLFQILQLSAKLAER